MRIRRSDGAIAWKLSGLPPANPAVPHLQILGDPHNGTAFQHDARTPGQRSRLHLRQPVVRSRLRSRAVEYAIDTGANTATLVWQYEIDHQVTAFGLGSARHQADGSTVIGWGPLQPFSPTSGPTERSRSPFARPPRPTTPWR